MDRILECKVCGKRFVALRRDATTCSARCRKKLSRTMAVVTDDVTLPAPVPPAIASGWLPLAAVPPPSEPPEPAPKVKVKVPTAFDSFGQPVAFMECESPEAAAHWDATAWRND